MSKYLESVRVGNQSSEGEVINILFPYKDNFRRTQMLSELSSKATTALSVLGVFRRMYNSRVLRFFHEELNLNKIAQDRKGRLEATEIAAAASKRNDYLNRELP